MYRSFSVKEAGCDPVEWIDLIQDGENMIVNFGFETMVENVLTDRATISFNKRGLLPGISWNLKLN
jgi:hypothetical protein